MGRGRPFRFLCTTTNALCWRSLWANSLVSCPLVAGVVPRHELIYEKLLYKMDASDDVSLLVVGRCSLLAYASL